MPMIMRRMRSSKPPPMRNCSLAGIVFACAWCLIVSASASSASSSASSSSSSSPTLTHPRIPLEEEEDHLSQKSRFRWFVPSMRRIRTHSRASNVTTSSLLLPSPQNENEEQDEPEDSQGTNPRHNNNHDVHVVDPAPSSKRHEEEGKAADFVRLQLRDRLDRVLSGKRQKDVAEWIQFCRTNGIVVSDDIRLITSLLLDSSGSSLSTNNKQRQQQSRDPFPLNRFNLELVPDLDMVMSDDASTDTVSSVAIATHDTNQQSSAALSTRISSLTSSVVAKAAWAAQLWMRTVQLSWNFGPVGTTVGLAYLSPSFRNNYWYKWLAHSMGKSGPAFIKWGQWSSTRPDLFPDAFCDALSALHSNAPAHSWSYSESTLAAALQLPPKPSSSALATVFDEIDHAPLASGSIAQVHKAVLDGRLVAIKIRHPRVEQLMEMDFTIMNWAAALLDGTLPLVKWLHVRETLAQFSTSLKAQADLRVEANHLELLNHNFRGWPHVRFPHPIFASAAVIIETFEPGRIVTTVLDMYDDLADTINREDALKELAMEEVRVQKLAASHKDDTTHSPSAPSYALVASGGSRKAAISDVAVAVASPNTESDDVDDDDDNTLQGHHLVPIAIAKFLVTTGLGVYLKMLLVDNLMHADLYVRRQPACGFVAARQQATSHAVLHFCLLNLPGTLATLWSTSIGIITTTRNGRDGGGNDGTSDASTTRCSPWSRTRTRPCRRSDWTGSWASAWSTPAWWRSSPNKRARPLLDS
jgi:ABC1 atypical kinase-like domain